MADDAPDTSTDTSPSEGGGPSPISRKVGPLPVWAWFVITAGVVGVYLIWRNNQGSSSSPLSTSGTQAVTGSTGVTQIDPLTGAQLLTAVENLNSTLQTQLQGGNAPGTTTAQIFGMLTGVRGGGVIHDAPDPAANVLGFFDPNNPLPIIGQPIAGGNYGGSTSPGLAGVSSNRWIPVDLGGTIGYIWSPEAIISQVTTNTPAILAPTAGAGLAIANTNVSSFSTSPPAGTVTNPTIQ